MHARLALVLAAALTAACSRSTPPAPAAPAQPAAEAQGRKELELYRQLQQEKSYELAAPIGAEIVAKYPRSPAAREVQETLADTTAKATALSTRRRLERLWSYQSGKESGGTQNTASIYSGDPTETRVRLVLRRHSAWGQSVYLFGSGKGFECGKSCTVGVHFDEQPSRRMKAYLPETGEPALFVSDDKAFLQRIGGAQKIAIEVVEKERGPRTLVFEVGGFDPEKFPPLKKG